MQIKNSSQKLLDPTCPFYRKSIALLWCQRKWAHGRLWHGVTHWYTAYYIPSPLPRVIQCKKKSQFASRQIDFSKVQINFGLCVFHDVEADNVCVPVRKRPATQNCLLRKTKFGFATEHKLSMSGFCTRHKYKMPKDGFLNR